MKLRCLRCMRDCDIMQAGSIVHPECSHCYSVKLDVHCMACSNLVMFTALTQRKKFCNHTCEERYGYQRRLAKQLAKEPVKPEKKKPEGNTYQQKYSKYYKKNMV